MCQQGTYAGDTGLLEHLEGIAVQSQGQGELVLLGICHPPGDAANWSGILSLGAWLTVSTSPEGLESCQLIVA